MTSTRLLDRQLAEVRRFLAGEDVTNADATRYAQTLISLVDEPATRAEAYMAHAMVRAREGDDAAALWADTAVDYAQRADSPSLLVQALCLRADTLMLYGQYEEAARNLERAGEAAEDPDELCRIGVSLARLELACDRATKLVERLGRVLVVIELAGDPYLVRLALAYHAVCLAISGQPALARQEFGRLREHASNEPLHPKLPLDDIARLINGEISADEEVTALVHRLTEVF